MNEDTIKFIVFAIFIAVVIFQKILARLKGGGDMSNQEEDIQRELQRRLREKESEFDGQELEDLKRLGVPLPPPRPVARQIEPSRPTAPPPFERPTVAPPRPVSRPPVMPVPVARPEPSRPRTIQAQPVMEPAAMPKAPKPRPAGASPSARRKRRRVRLNPKLMGKVVVLSEILRPPVSMRNTNPGDQE